VIILGKLLKNTVLLSDIFLKDVSQWERILQCIPSHSTMPSPSESQPLCVRTYLHFTSTGTIWKVCGLTLLLQVRTLWRCSDSLFFKVTPLESNVLLWCSTHFSKRGCRSLITPKFLPWGSLFMVGKAQKSDGARSELNWTEPH